jgi:quercetin dioxygenase-like cupin family protein
MTKWKQRFAIAVFAAALSGVAAAQHAHTFATAKNLKWGDTPSLPGAKVAVVEGPMNEEKPFILRIKFPANYRIAPHFHSSIEHVTVISGEFFMGMGEKFQKDKGTGLKRGDIAIMQPKTPHYAYTKKETEVQVHGMGPWTLTYVNPADDPRKK